MTGNETKTTIKRTVVLHSIMDKCVRNTWAMLIEEGYDATYSMALNFMLLATIMELQKEEGWSEETADTVWNFADDQKTIGKLNIQDYLANLRKYWGKED